MGYAQHHMVLEMGLQRVRLIGNFFRSTEITPWSISTVSVKLSETGLYGPTRPKLDSCGDDSAWRVCVKIVNEI